MRILHVNKFLYRRGGAEAYAQDLAQLQHVAGHEVTFFGMRHPDNDTYRYEQSFPSHVDFDPMPASPIGKAQTFGRMLWSTTAARGIDQVLTDFQPDVVHLHNIYHQLSPSVLRPIAKRGIPAVMTLHDHKLACPTYLLLDHGKPCTACVTGGPLQAIKRNCHGSRMGSAAAAIETLLHRKMRAYSPVDRFLCPSWFLSDIMRSAGVFPDRMHVQDNFIDSAAITPAHLPGLGAAFVGRLSAEKGVEVLIRAWPNVPHHAHLHIAGDGPDRSALERLAEDLAPGRVTFHGRLDKAKVYELMRATAVTVLPSIVHENQPISVLEAFACGRPVVGTRLGGIPEMIDIGIDGDIAPAGDPDALAETVRPFVADPERSAEMGAVARAKVERRFDAETHAAAVEEHYRAALAGKGNRGTTDANDAEPESGDGGPAWPAGDLRWDRAAR